MFWTLGLAHLIADYPLQTDGLVRAKRNRRGLALHVAIHLVTMLALCGRDSLVVWPALLVLTAAHYAIDSLKTSVAKRQPRRVVAPYVADQLLHIATIFLVASWIEAQFGVRRDENWMIYIAAYLSATHVWFISERIVAHGDPRYQEAVQAHRRSRPIVRGLALTAYLLAGGLLTSSRSGIAPLPVLPPWLPPYGCAVYGRRMLVQDLLGPLPVAVLVLVLVS